MLKKIFLSLLVINLVTYLNASIITNGNGVSMSGRLNRDGLTSSLIKSQQLNDEQRSNLIEPSLSNLDDPINGENDRKNDNAHFSLFYKSNSPGQLVTHELEHRFRKNPLNYYPPNSYLMRSNSIPNNDNTNSLDSSNVRYIPNNNNNNNIQYQLMNNLRNNKNRQTMFNIHYHDNLDNDLGYGVKPQENQWQKQKLEQMVRNNYQLKMMLMNLAQQPPQAHQQSQISRVGFFPQSQPLPSSAQQQQQQQQQPRLSSNQETLPNYLQDLKNNENNLQYKIVNLKLRVEPQNGKLVGQGVVETDNEDSASMLNANHFSLWPKELPQFIRRLLSSQVKMSSMSKREEDMAGFSSSGLSDEVSSVVEKRGSDEEETHLDSLEKKQIDSLIEKNVDSEKMKDSEFQETLKSLQKRDEQNESASSTISTPEIENPEKSLNERSEEESQESDSSIIN